MSEIHASVGARLAASVGAMTPDAAATLSRPAAEESWPIGLPAFTTTVAAGAATIANNGLGPRAGYAWDVRRITVAGLAGNDLVTVYRALLPAAVGAQPQNALYPIVGSGGGTDFVFTGKGALILRPGEFIVVAGTGLAAASLTLSLEGALVPLNCLSRYIS